MNITTYLELRSVYDEETSEFQITSAWMVIKADSTNEVILSQDLTHNEELIELFKKRAIVINDELIVAT